MRKTENKGTFTKDIYFSKLPHPGKWEKISFGKKKLKMKKAKSKIGEKRGDGVEKMGIKEGKRGKNGENWAGSYFLTLELNDHFVRYIPRRFSCLFQKSGGGDTLSLIVFFRGGGG